MWLITPAGFFSIVCKPDDRHAGTLTVRARVRSDLVALRADLPSLGPIRESGETDYRFRAKAKKKEVAQALARMVETLSYDNFKSEVARRQGVERAHLYHDVWNVLYRMQGDPAFEMVQAPNSDSKGGIPKADAYGGVLIDDDGLILLRKPAGDFGGYAWTFPKGRPDPGETPEQAAIREVLEETGQSARIVAVIPKIFVGTTTLTAFFLMSPEGSLGLFTSETAEVRWVDEEEAARLIKTTKTALGRGRDLAVLKAGFAAWRVVRRSTS